MAAGDKPADAASWVARFAAPIALIVVTIAVIAVIGGSDGGGGDGERAGDSAEAEQTTTTSTKPPPKTYVVQPLDNLNQIASEFGLTVDELVKLNPDADPQALITGTKLKLR